MQVRIISLHEATRLVRTMRKLVPGADVRVQRGIDLRSVPTDDLHATRMVSHGAAIALHQGRKWHHELSSKGAVGLAHAVRLALEDSPRDEPLLLLEDDCDVSDPQRFKRDLAQLLRHLDEFDMASFGSNLLDDKNNMGQIPYLSDGFVEIDGLFWWLHCVLFSPRGRARVARHLRDPLDMQIDSLYGSLASIGELTIFAHIRNASTRQTIHKSSIQESTVTCFFCNVSAERLKMFENRFAHICIVLMAVSLLVTAGPLKNALCRKEYNRRVRVRAA